MANAFFHIHSSSLSDHSALKASLHTGHTDAAFLESCGTLTHFCRSCANRSADTVAFSVWLDEAAVDGSVIASLTHC